jgi:hypothetical protein
LIKKPTESAEDIVVDHLIAKRIELRDQIAQLLIENPLSLDEFLTLEDETVVDDDSDIFTSVVEHYSTDKPGQEEQSSDEEEEVEEVEEVDTAKALKAIETVKLWKLQEGDSQDLQALDRVEREITRYKSDSAHQTTIFRFFKPK